MNLVAKLGVGYLEEHRFGCVIVFEPPDLRLVHLTHREPQPLRKIGGPACIIPVEAEKRLAAPVTTAHGILVGIDDAFNDLLERGRVDKHLRIDSASILLNEGEKKYVNYIQARPDAR